MEFFLSTTQFNERFGIDHSIKQDSDHNDISLKKVDIEHSRFPFKDKTFDVVTMLAVFEHIQANRLEFVLKEIKRVLKEDGTFIMTTPAPWAQPILSIFAKFNLLSKEEIHDHKTAYSIEDITRIITNSGFNKSKIKKGYFEIFCNMWFCVEK